MNRARILLVVLLAAAPLTSCRSPDRGPTVGEPLADYVATTLEGDSVALSSLHGDVVLLNLWATWCVPCRTETPYLQSVYEQHEDKGLRVVGVSLDVGNASEAIEAFVEEFGVTYTILHDPQMRALDLYRVIGLPGSFLVDREGVLRWMHYGPIVEGDSVFLRALEDVLSRARR